MATLPIVKYTLITLAAIIGAVVIFYLLFAAYIMWSHWHEQNEMAKIKVTVKQDTTLCPSEGPQKLPFAITLHNSSDKTADNVFVYIALTFGGDKATQTSYAYSHMTPIKPGETIQACYQADITQSEAQYGKLRSWEVRQNPRVRYQPPYLQKQ